MEYCEYGCGQEAKFKTKGGKAICSKSHSSCPSVRTKNSETLKEALKNKPNSSTIHKQKGLQHWNLGRSPWNKGLTSSSDARIALIAKKSSDKLKGNTIFRDLSEDKKELFRKNRSIEMKKRYKNGWQPTCGRCKKIDYFSPIAGRVKVDGSWELLVVQKLDELCIDWRRNTKRFPYVNLKGTESTYCPDFYLPKKDVYIEVKGYETELDRTKWAQFSERLIVLKKKEILLDKLISLASILA